MLGAIFEDKCMEGERKNVRDLKRQLGGEHKWM